MVRTLNGSLARKGSAYRIVEQDYENVDYNAILRLPEHQSLLRPFLVEEIEFTNLSSSEQEMTSTVSKEIAETSEWHITAGLKIGLSVEAEAGAFFAKAKTTMSAEISVEGGTRQSETTMTTVSKNIGLKVPSRTITTLSALLEQEEARNVPFIIDCVVHRGPFKIHRLAPVYRFFNSKRTYHCYTTDRDEAEAWRNNPDLIDETATSFLGYVYPVQEPGTVPVFRFYSEKSGDYVCTSDEIELEELRKRSDFVEQSRLGFVYATPEPNIVQVGRFWGKKSWDHVYTTDPTEQGKIRSWRDFVEETATRRFGYVYRELPESQLVNLEITALLDETERAFQVCGVFTGTSISSKVSIMTEEKPLSALTEAAAASLASPPAEVVVRSPEVETVRTLRTL
jgi:hypothetical protein